jgi:hypothetical protein
MFEVPPKLVEQRRILEAERVCGQGGIDLLARGEEGPPHSKDIASHPTCRTGSHAGVERVQARVFAFAVICCAAGAPAPPVVVGSLHDQLPGCAVRAMWVLRFQC